MTSDGGRWWNITPRPGALLTGEQKVHMQFDSKPANLHSRTAIITLEVGTYPFNRTVDISVMQGLRFDYYLGMSACCLMTVFRCSCLSAGI